MNAASRATRWFATGVFMLSITLNFLDRQLLAAVAISGASTALGHTFRRLAASRMGLGLGESTAIPLLDRTIATWLDPAEMEISEVAAGRQESRWTGQIHSKIQELVRHGPCQVGVAVMQMQVQHLGDTGEDAGPGEDFGRQGRIRARQNGKDSRQTERRGSGLENKRSR